MNSAIETRTILTRIATGVNDYTDCKGTAKKIEAIVVVDDKVCPVIKGELNLLLPLYISEEDNSFHQSNDVLEMLELNSKRSLRANVIYHNNEAIEDTTTKVVSYFSEVK